MAARLRAYGLNWRAVESQTQQKGLDDWKNRFEVELVLEFATVYQALPRANQQDVKVVYADTRLSS